MNVMRNVLYILIAFVFALTGVTASGQNTKWWKVRAARPSTMPVMVGSTRFDMVLVQGGSYMMGCDPQFWETSGKNDEMPRHGVRVGSFYMGRYEVTQRLWTEVMGYNPSNFVGDDLPVEQVSFFEVQTFIAKLNALTGLEFRLPTEAEWEYAARGGNMSGGHPYAGDENVMQVAWSQLNSLDSTHIVGGLVPNELGLYDMSGNVWEWCADWYSSDEYAWNVAMHFNAPDYVRTREDLARFLESQDLGVFKRKLSGTMYECTMENEDPRGPDTGSLRVGRGGSWTDETENMRVAYRNFWDPRMKLSVLGFRLALSCKSVPAGGWMPNQYVLDSVADNNLYATMTMDKAQRMSEGTLEGLFSVAKNKKVRFSKGNLQYNPAANQFRFAERQYDFVGWDNSKLDKNYAGWIDLFAYGTSGYRDKTPYYSVLNNTYYGNGEKNLEGTSYDWGVYNRILGGGEREGMWRTLSVNEWAYLLMRRPDAMLLRCIAVVNGVKGIVLMPDDWLERGNDTLAGNLARTYNVAEWGLMEANGAVFLPCAGYAKMNVYHVGIPLQQEDLIEGFNVGYGVLVPQTSEPVSAKAQGAGGANLAPMEQEYGRKCKFRPAVEDDFQSLGYYWTTVHWTKSDALGFCFAFGNFGYIMPLERMTRLSVRLVRNEGK